MTKTRVVMVRHGETEWTASKQHTSFTDLSLTSEGVEQAKHLSGKLNGEDFAKVFVSPLKRAKETCEIAGFLEGAEECPELTEWNYGEYEGLTTPQIRETVPGWGIFTHGAKGGESVRDVEERTDRLIEKLRTIEGTVAIFTSGHIGRVIGARWIGLPAEKGASLLLSTASISIMGYEREHPALFLWNSNN